MASRSLRPGLSLVPAMTIKARHRPVSTYLRFALGRGKRKNGSKLPSGMHAPHEVQGTLKVLRKVIIGLEEDSTARYGGLAVTPWQPGPLMVDKGAVAPANQDNDSVDSSTPSAAWNTREC